MMKIFVVWILVLCSSVCNSQSSYVIDAFGNIYNVDIGSNCKTTLVYHCPHYSMTDVAADFSGNIYACNFDSLFVLDTNNTAAGFVFLGNFPDQVTGLTVLNDGKVYASGYALTTYDPLTQTFTHIGNFPPNVISAGDLVLYNGKVYMSTNEASIYEINLADPASSALYYDLGVGNIYGMVVISTKCFNQPTPQPRIIAFQQTGYTSRGYLIDMENKITFPDYCLPQIGIVGATAINYSEVIGDPMLINSITIKRPLCNQHPDGTISVTMAPSSVNKYSFSLDNQDDTAISFFSNLSAGPHAIRVKNQYGCYIDTTATVPAGSFDICVDSVFIPSAFTPDGDQLNDVFRAKSFVEVKNFEIEIYNRYGQKMYASSFMNEGWDGKFKSSPQPSGVYAWIVRYTNLSGKRIFRKGLVTLLR